MTSAYALRLAAAKAGAKTYAGKPCARHPEALRYVSNSMCTECIKESSKTRANVLRKLLAGSHPTDDERK